ncbi:MAG: carboxylating nicotinate-nucleotide diphosphorylase [Planctomycetota bacterium]|nr:carboxylating nicotinate-nucleotide diphosphorylase [Planctomycetota bacterium]
MSTTPAPDPVTGLPAPRVGRPRPLDPGAVRVAVEAALAEDLGSGDVTSEGAVPAEARAVARLVAKEEGVIAGLDLFVAAFELRDPEARIECAAADGDAVRAGQELVRVEGRARALLEAERTALNFIQRLSGTATLTRRFVEAVAASPGVRVLDTRKTTPGLRLFEKHAVRAGGGENHRFGLFDEAMIKENHAALAGRPVPEALRALRAQLGDSVRITCEARDEAEALAAVEGGADVVLLDNFAAGELPAVCARLRAAASGAGRAVELEASGGLTLETVAQYAAAGVDRLSVGALTHSARALDLSLYLEPCP